MLRTSIAIALILAVGALGWAEDANVEDFKKLQGKWTIESASFNGKELKEQNGGRLVFDETSLRILPPSKDKGGDAVTFRVDATKKPKTLSLVSDATKKAPNLGRMAYEIDGDTLKIAIGLANKPPADISDKGQILWTLKRTKD